MIKKENIVEHYNEHGEQSYMFPKFDCPNWNASIYVGSNSPSKLVAVKFDTFQEQKECFSSYKVSLYRLWSGYTEHCNPYKGTRIFTNTVKQQRDQVLSTTFNDLSNGFFCTLITPCTNFMCFERWSLHSNVVSIEANKVLKPKTEQPIKSPTAEILSVLFILFLTLGFGFWMLWKYKRSKVKKKPSVPIRSTEEFPLLPSENISCYIFYEHKSETKINVMLLKKFLENVGFKVILIDDVLEEIFINPVMWHFKTLKFKCSKVENCNSNKRFIIVQSENVICAMKYKRVIDENVTESTCSISSYSDDGDIQDDWFHYTVNYISIDWEKAFKDFCHLFVVYFEDLDVHQFRNIVHTARFKFPEHLISLCINLNNSLGNTEQKKQLLLLLKKPLEECFDSEIVNIVNCLNT